MIISLCVAMAENRAIGLDNKMPWHLSADLKNFKKITMGKPILMGRKTFESIGKPLPGRQNVIVTRNKDYRQPDCVVSHSLDEALDICAGSEEVMVIGGADIYRTILPRADRMYLTLIHAEFRGDTFFPETDWSQWQEVQREDISDDRSVFFAYSFIVLEKSISIS